MKRLALALFLALCSMPGLAQLRTLPEDATRGVIRHVADMDVEVDGARARLAPGAQIRDGANRLVLPTALPAGALVKYVRDGQGLVHRVWVLTPEEAARPDKR